MKCRRKLPIIRKRLVTFPFFALLYAKSLNLLQKIEENRKLIRINLV